MQISPLLHLLPLGWLPLTQAAWRDGFLPIYRRLEQDGFPIFDEWGYLDPDLKWRDGRGTGGTEWESDLTLRLLKSSADTVSGLQDNGGGTLERRQGTYHWPPEYLSQRIPYADEIARAWIANDAKRIQLTSPTIPKHKTRTEWLKALPEILPVRYQMRLNFLARNPAHLVRVGVQMLCMEWDTHGQSRHQTAEALAIINLGALGLFPRVRCAVCYRLALPSSTRCAMHSQTQAIRCNEIVGRALHTQISSETRKAREVMAKLGWGRNEFAIDPFSGTFAEENVISGILWGLYSGVGDSLQQVRDFLHSGRFPHVVKLLPENFIKLNDARACACLRQHIDPCEWDVGNWFCRLLAAEEWLAAAAKLTPGRAHMQVSDLNQNRYTQAKNLLRRGLKKKLIAEKLGISQSHLSHLLKRLS